MEHEYRNDTDRRSPGIGKRLLGRVPRWLKISLALVIIFIVIMVLLVILFVVLLFIKLLAGGSLPQVLEGLLDWIQSNLQPLLKVWNDLQGLVGG